jgi:hypothetical protein
MAFISAGNKAKFNFIKCGLCGTLTTNAAASYGVCPSCVQEDARLYGLARDAMSLNQNIGLVELRAKTGIEAKILQRWVDTGRLRSAR